MYIIGKEGVKVRIIVGEKRREWMQGMQTSRVLAQTPDFMTVNDLVSMVPWVLDSHPLFPVVLGSVEEPEPHGGS